MTNYLGGICAACVAFAVTTAVGAEYKGFVRSLEPKEHDAIGARVDLVNIDSGKRYTAFADKKAHYAGISVASSFSIVAPRGRYNVVAKYFNPYTRRTERHLSKGVILGSQPYWQRLYVDPR